MGALATAWQGRLSLQVQKALTNPDVEGATSVDTTRLGYAETDAMSQFFSLTGVTFDATNQDHLTIGVLGVSYWLQVQRNQPKSAATEAAKALWTDACNKYARVGGSLVPLLPQTSSTLSPSDPQTGLLPDFDRGRLNDLVPRPPGTGSDDRDPVDFSRGA